MSVGKSQLETLLLALFGANCGCFCWLTALIEVFVVLFTLVDLSICPGQFNWQERIGYCCVTARNVECGFTFFACILACHKIPKTILRKN